LDLSDCYQINDHFFTNLKNAFPSLESINLSGCVLISGKGFDMLFKQMNGKLQKLYLRGCLKQLKFMHQEEKDLRLRSFEDVHASELHKLMISIARYFPLLKELDLYCVGGRIINEEDSRLIEEGISRLSSSLSQLQCIDLRQNAWMKEEILSAFITNCKSGLKTLRFDGLHGAAFRYSTQFFNVITKNHCKLENLECNVAGVSNSVIIELLSNLTNLSALSISHTLSINGSIVSQLQKLENMKSLSMRSCYILEDGVKLLHSFKNLEFLDLTWEQNLTDKMIIQVLLTCPKLRTFDISNSKISDTNSGNVSLKKYEKLVNGRTFPQLKEVNFGEILTNLQDKIIKDMLISICCWSPNLEIANLANCVGFNSSKQRLFELSKCCPRIKVGDDKSF
jgi:hypothetical protein